VSQGPRDEVRAVQAAPEVAPAEESAGPATPPDTGGRRTIQQREQRLAFALIAPGVVIVLALVVLPVLWNVGLSFRELRLIELRDFSPLTLDLSIENYDEVLGDADFFELLRTTVVYAVAGTAASILLGLWAAVVVQKAFPGRFVVRGLILFPYVVPVVAAALLWRTMLNPQIGILSSWLQSLFSTGNVDFLTNRSFDLELFGVQFGLPAAFTMIILFEGWRSFPFAFLFILARLQALPAELYEASEVDGASALQTFRHITLPQLRGVIAVLVLLRFIWTFNTFDEIYLLTGGAGGTQVVSVQIYEYLFGRSDIGAASALSIVLALALIVLLALYFRFAPVEETG
jgi:multiple sugar transport system permease protein